MQSLLSFEAIAGHVSGIPLGWTGGSGAQSFIRWLPETGGCFGPGLCEILASLSRPAACPVQPGIEVGGDSVRGLRPRSERLLVWVVHTDMGFPLLRHALGPPSWWVLRTHQGPTRDTPRPGTGWGFAGFLVGDEGSCL